MTTPNYQHIADNFDQVADSYDAIYGEQGANRLVQWFKAELWQLYQPYTANATRILEIGCGTGEDACHFAALGKEVLATDISPQMLAATQARARAAGLTHLHTHLLPCSQLQQLTAHYAAGSVQAAYSSITLNYEPDLPAMARGLAQLMPTGGVLLANVFSRTCIWEIGWWFLHGHPIGAFRRWRTWRNSQIGAGRKIPCQYYSPSQFCRLMQPYFKPKQIIAVNLVMPAPFLDPLYQRHQAFFDRQLPWERRLRTAPLLRGWGHTFLAVLERTP